MNIDELIAAILRIVNLYSGTFYTSTRLRHNPDVCHAACIWFLNNVQRMGLRGTITQLDSMDKSTLKRTQEGVMKGPSMPRAMLGHAIASGKAINDRDTNAIEYMIDYWRQPGVYSANIPEVIHNIVRAMRSTADSLVIYMTPGMGGAGHVICLTRNVGGVVIYDPNMGVITLQLSNVDAWSGVLTMIFQWYAREMGLVLFGYR